VWRAGVVAERAADVDDTLHQHVVRNLVHDRADADAAPLVDGLRQQHGDALLDVLELFGQRVYRHDLEVAGL
jgi:hypothetical protein